MGGDLAFWRDQARQALGEEAVLKLDRKDALFVTRCGAPVPGFAQEARAGGLYALSPITGYPPETQRVYLALLKQTAHRDSQFPALVRAARGRMAVCLRTHEQDDGLAMLEALIQQIEREESG